MNPGEIYTAPDGRKYRAEKTESYYCFGCHLLYDEVDCDDINCYDPEVIIFKRVTKNKEK